jgi:hypothetical protein
MPKNCTDYERQIIIESIINLCSLFSKYMVKDGQGFTLSCKYSLVHNVSCSLFLFANVMTIWDLGKDNLSPISSSIGAPCVSCIFSVCHGPAQVNFKICVKHGKTTNITTKKMLKIVYGNKTLSYVSDSDTDERVLKMIKGQSRLNC